MARIKLPLPQKKLFETTIPICVEHLNYGNHVGNDVYLRLCHEARLRWLKSHGLSEVNEDGLGLIMGDAALVYKHEVFHGDLLKIELGLGDIGTHSFELLYLLSNQEAVECARIQTGMVCFDYHQRKVSALSESWRHLLSQEIR